MVLSYGLYQLNFGVRDIQTTVKKSVHNQSRYVSTVASYRKVIKKQRTNYITWLISRFRNKFLIDRMKTLITR